MHVTEPLPQLCVENSNIYYSAVFKTLHSPACNSLTKIQLHLKASVGNQLGRGFSRRLSAYSFPAQVPVNYVAFAEPVIHKASLNHSQ